MAFWSTELISGTRDPKRQFRFKVIFGGLDNANDGVIWWAKTVNKPSYTVTESDHTYLNHKFYFPGRVEWDPVTLALVDPVSPNATAQISALIRAAGYTIPGDATTLETMSKGKATTSLGAVSIIQVDAEGKSIENWSLKNAFIKSVKFGDLDYSGDDLIQIDLELRYDWAELSFDTNNVPDVADLAKIEGGTKPKDDRKFYGVDPATPAPV